MIKAQFLAIEKENVKLPKEVDHTRTIIKRMKSSQKHKNSKHRVQQEDNTLLEDQYKQMIAQTEENENLLNIDYTP